MVDVEVAVDAFEAPFVTPEKKKIHERPLCACLTPKLTAFIRGLPVQIRRFQNISLACSEMIFVCSSYLRQTDD